jgi:hypothetical protein
VDLASFFDLEPTRRRSFQVGVRGHHAVGRIGAEQLLEHAHVGLANDEQQTRGLAFLLSAQQVRVNFEVAVIKQCDVVRPYVSGIYPA